MNYIKIIENLNQLPCHDESKVDLLLASKGLKKATEFIFFEPQKITEEILDKTEQIFKKLGLYYIRNRRELTDSMKWKEYIIGKNKEDVLLFQKLWNKGDDFRERTKILGKLLGFPETAISAYIKKETISKFDFFEQVKRGNFLAFGSFAFSKDNWKEEVKIVEKWSKTIKNMDRNLYNKMIDKYKKDVKSYKIY